ncbi:hypothetical protein JNG78_12300 [Proteus mirabilis]|nr:hypothetical protein [Proteus mirabilis]MCI9728495.1 hypothetical protein [Proteus mirabilis]MCI9732252.1 hypothetical protein [Proteus mirabilis]MCI9736007.1 hypothetical protein [Proteus mirabilis]MCI9756798.1 hypothetical protein [Proteus mirabilis]MCI9760556.1 hypothetical protein [Proteus mirabilis]
MSALQPDDRAEEKLDRWPGFVEALARKSSVEQLLRALTEAVDTCD